MEKFFEGVSKSEALIAASLELEVPRSDLKYEVVSEQGEGMQKRVRIRVTGATKREPAAPETVAIDYQTALAPLRQYFEKETFMKLDDRPVRSQVAFVDFDWLEAQDEAYWKTMEHDDDRASQLLRQVDRPADKRLIKNGLWRICAAVGVSGTYWHEYGFGGSGMHGLLILDLRKRVGDSCPVLYLGDADEPLVVAESVPSLVALLSSEQERPGIDHQTALEPLRKWFEKDTFITIEGQRCEVAFFDYDRADDGRRLMDSRQSQLWAMLTHPPYWELAHAELWLICGVVGVPSAHWNKHGLDRTSSWSSDATGLLVLNLRERVGDSCPVLFVSGSKKPIVLAKSAFDLHVET